MTAATAATRDIIQDGIADPKNDNAVVKAYVLSHGTMEVYSLKESRRFYEEFLREYDGKARATAGAFYTPARVVDLMNYTADAHLYRGSRSGCGVP
jgi:hypothetical protein